MPLFHPYVRIALAILASLVLMVLGMAVLKSLGLDLKKRKGYGSAALLVAGVINLAIIVAIFLLYTYLNKRPLSSLGFGFSSKDLQFCICAAALTFLLAYAWIRILHTRGIIHIRKPQSSPSVREERPNLLLGLIVLFLAAFHEEALYRGYITQTLGQSLWHALIVTTLLFTVIHYVTSQVTVYNTINWLLGGIVLFFAYILSGSLWVAALVHYFRNTANALILNIAGNYGLIPFEKKISPPLLSLYYGILSALSLVLLVLFYGWPAQW